MKLKNFFVVLFTGVLILLSGCTDKHYTVVQEVVDGDYGNAYVFSSNDIVIEAQDWTWVPELNRYESEPKMIEDEKGNPYLNTDIFEYGKVMVDAFVTEWGVEVTKTLPYEKDFFQDVEVNGEILKVWDFTQRVSFEMLGSDNHIIFFIESTDKFILDTYVFKVVVLWDGIVEN